MRVCVLGHRGMLGHVVARYLGERGLEVLVLDRRFSPQADPASWIGRINALRPHWCVNAIGIRSGPDLDATNHRLPAALSRHLPPSCSLVHASTDGVFRADAGACPPDRTPDAVDPYGLSKRSAEESLRRPNDHVVRTSLVGPEQDTRRGLLSWLEAQRGPIEGWTDRIWNGITTLEWARVCHSLMTGALHPAGRVVQPGFLPPVSKCQLLRTMAECWRWPVAIRAARAPSPVTRHLLPNAEVPDPVRQLETLRGWY